MVAGTAHWSTIPKKDQSGESLPSHLVQGGNKMQQASGSPGWSHPPSQGGERLAKTDGEVFLDWEEG